MLYNELTIKKGKHHFHQIQLYIISCRQKKMCMSTRNSNVSLKFRTLPYTADREKWKGTEAEVEENANLKTS